MKFTLRLTEYSLHTKYDKEEIELYKTLGFVFDDQGYTNSHPEVELNTLEELLQFRDRRVINFE
jgi:hypothetical protein